MVLKLYYDMLSQPGRALYIFLKVTKTPFEACTVSLLKGEHLTKKYEQECSRFKKLPVIHHDDFRLTESVGILRYIAREFPIEDHWYPKNSQKQALVDEYLEWHHSNIRQTCLDFFRHQWIIPLRTGKQPSAEESARHEKNMLRSLKDFERLFLSDKPFIHGNEISFSDLQAACEIEQPRFAGYDPRKDFPKIKVWIENVRKECNPYYDEAHQYLNDEAEKRNTQ
uniref:glutathione transferase n=1 Tax=Phaedon brassicae TaxID=154011 RepID=A0A9Y1LRN8_9CUCU|nr:glutathione S-transferase [Phaedon brassicae]WET52805.1 glutathione S-transferase [Phaedon brassicae]